MTQASIPHIAPQKLRFTVSTPCELHGRALLPGDVVVLDPERRDILVATTLPHDPQGVLTLLTEGSLAPVGMPAPSAEGLLSETRPATRMLTFPTRVDA